MTEKTSTGTLFIVATPLGNLEDMTFRAVNVMKTVDLIAAEDTRHSIKLLNHYGIDTRLVSCHEHNENQKTPKLIADLKNGMSIALISDAGTPTISDPGYKVVKAAADNNINVVPIPGCSAVIAGLSVSGLPTDSFYFAGFLPRKKQKLTARLLFLRDHTATLVFYESPKRIISLLNRIIPVFGNRNACLAREISKIHEEYLRGTLSVILEILEQKPAVKGECTLFIQGACLNEKISPKALDAVIKERLSISHLSTSNLAKQIAGEYRIPRKKIYDRILFFSNKKS